MARENQTVVLPDGRTLGYAEYGNSSGAPLIYFHGFPSSRLEGVGLEEAAKRRNIRVLALDRPGYGLSTAQPNRRIIDWPTDVRHFAEHAGLKRFAVVGVSGGGPYALACANMLPPSMLSGVGVIAGAMPWAASRQHVKWSSWFVYLAGTYWPSGLRMLSAGVVGLARWFSTMEWVTKRADAWLESLAKEKREKQAQEAAQHDTDKALSDPVEPAEEKPISEKRAQLLRFVFEPFSQGTGEVVRETKLLTQDWGFKFEDVAYDPVRVWHGDQDRNAPISMMRYMVDRLPHCEFTVYEGMNHYRIGDKFDEIVDQLMKKELRLLEEEKKPARMPETS